MANKIAVVIEDEKELALIFAEALADAGFRPEIFYDGGPALSRLIEIVPTLVILDLNLPNITGSEVMSLLKTDRRLANVKTIITTGNSHKAEEFQNDVDILLFKPVSYSQLRDLALSLLAD